MSAERAELEASEEASARDVRVLENHIAFLLDGSNPQVKWLSSEDTREKYKHEDLSGLKSPASTTSHLAANDVMKGHANYRSLAHSDTERQSECPPKTAWPKFVLKVDGRLERYAPGLKKKNRDQIIKHLCHLPTFFNNAINTRTIVSGFKTCAVWPFDAAAMLARCDMWTEFSQDHQALMVAAVPKISAEIALHGTSSDEIFFDALPFLKPDVAPKGKPKDDRAWGRRRSLFFLNESFAKWTAAEAAKTQAREAEKEAEKAQKLADKVAKREKKEREKLQKRQELAEKKRKKVWEKTVAKAKKLSRKQSFKAPEDDWTCYVCFASWEAWQKVGLTEAEDAGNAWLQGDSDACDHTFCPSCMTEDKVDEHARGCGKQRRDGLADAGE